MGRGRFSWRVIARLLFAACVLAPAAAHAATDLQVSQYDFTPDPVPNAGKATFDIRVTNTGPAIISDAIVTIQVSNNFQIVTAGADPDTIPGGCTLAGAVGAQTLTCALPPFVIGNQFLEYTAHAMATGAQPTSATIHSASAGDPNAANDSLTITPAVVTGADLSTALADDSGPGHSVPAGSTLHYTVTVTNSGPNPTNAIRLVDQLPPASDFTFVSASGTNWSCSISAQVVTCDYTGAALAVPAVLPSVTITGKVVSTTSGTITDNAFATLTLSSVGDPNPGNDAAPPVVTTITAGTDLKATKTINGTAGPTTVVIGTPANVVIGITNIGPQSVTGATVTDNMPASLTIGTLPAGCGVSGQTITCTSGAIAVANAQTWTIPVSGNSVATGQINTATVAPPAGVADPIASNNTASVSFDVSNPAADLTLTKNKGSTPVAPNQTILNTIVVKNLGPSPASYAPGSEIIVTDTVSADELYDSNNAGWACTTAGAVITCKTTGTASLAVGATLSLLLTTRASPTANGPLTNNACTGSTAGSLATPPDPAADSNDCSGPVTLPASTTSADLTVDKQVSIDNVSYTHGTLSVPAQTAPTFTPIYIRFVAHNAGPDQSTNVTVKDPLGTSGALASTIFSTASVTAGTPAFAANGDLTWTLGTMAANATETLIVKLDRPFNAVYNAGTGAAKIYTNVATIAGADIFDPTPANNTSSATYQIEPEADVAVTQNIITANPAQVGVVATYTWSVRNNRNFALGVHFTNDIDLTRFELVGSPTTTKPGGTCSSSTAGNIATIACDLGVFADGTTYQVSQQVRPVYDGAASYPLTVTDSAHVTTTSVEPTADLPNNQLDLTHQIISPKLDLAISNVEPSAAYDPLGFGDDLVYDLHVSNFGPASRAHNVTVTDTFVPPAGYHATFDTFAINPAGATATGGTSLTGAPGANCTAAGLTVSCVIDTIVANNYLDKLKQVIFRVMFKPDPAETLASGSLTYTNNAQIVSDEQPNTTTSVADDSLSNNKATQTTTVLPKADLEVVSKTPLIASASVNQPIPFDIVIRNNGPSDTPQVRVADQLPAGFVRDAGFTATAVVAGSASVSSISCTGTNLIQCVLNGNIPADGSPITIRIQALAKYPYVGPFNSNVADTATISPGLDGGGVPVSVDSVAANNSQSANVQIIPSSIAGTVFVDADLDNVVDAGEGKSGVAVRLTGTDAYGNAIGTAPIVTQNTGGAGSFNFTGLPPGTYNLIETDPGLIDGLETAPGANGVVNNSGFDATAAHNSITAITLAANTALAGYQFQEIAPALIAGSIYKDLNNNGQQDGGEPGFVVAEFPSSPQIQLTGNDLYGRAVNLTATINASGAYSFPGLAPSDGAGYTITELVQPTGFADGKDSNGTGNVVVGSGGRTAPETIPVGIVSQNAALTHRDFGELVSATLAGSVFLDANSNAVRDVGETSGLNGGVVHLTGTDQFGNAVDCSITTSPTGTFSFPNAADANPACHVLQGGTYTLTETPPNGFTHVGVYIGSSGGTAGAVSGANTPSVGINTKVVSAIALGAGVSATNYNFAESGQGFAGYVYADRNNNGQRDADETGIAGVSVTLSGTSGTGQDVCTLIACTAITDSAGNFLIPNVPGSNATGYTLTEQSQATAPLNAYGDGQDGAGTVAGVVRGTAGNDVISGIVLATGELGTNYRFGETAASLSGAAYADLNNDGARGAEPGIPGVTVTLSGTTTAGADICTQRAALTPPLTCAAVTDATGAYRFADLPAGSYTLVETQLSNYLDGKESSGTPAGTVNNASFGPAAATNTIGTIGLGAGIAGIAYDFGEVGAVLSGRVFKDPQRDGVDSGGEPGIGGVTVTLVAGGVTVATTTTAADGGYSFTGLSAGSYSVIETQPGGYGSSSPDTVGVTVTAGVNQTVNFGDTVSTIAGTVFVDANNDGIYQAGEQPIAGVTVKLSGTTAAGATVALTTTTSAAGLFSFADIQGGTYTLTETQPAAYADGKDSAGSSGGTVGNDVISAIALAGGVDAIAYAFGETGQAISGIVYVDVNLNGRQDSGEPGVPGVAIAFQHADGSTIATATTGADGGYSFPVPGAGDYILIETQPSGYGNAAENGNNRATVTVGTATPPQINFGERLGSLSGLVYNDSNSNNRRDPTEPALGGVTLTLTGTDLNGLTVSRTAISGKDGTFVFNTLAGGTYTLVETQPANFQDGGDTPGSAGGSALPIPGDTISGITIGAAQDATGYLFGEHGPAAQLSGSVWFDADHDGVRDLNEQGKSNWTVQLFLGGVQVASTTTDANGQYHFSDLPPGSGYALLFRDPVSQAAFGSAKPNESGLPASDGVTSPGNPGGADFASGQIREITLTPGANVQQQSLPLDPSGVVYDSVTRQLVPGATVKISGPAGFDPATQLLGGAINASQTVGPDGFYQFLLLAGAPNGVYTISYTPPAGGAFNPTTPSVRIPPCSGPYTVGATPDPLLISSYDGAPPASAIASCTVGTGSTGYFLSFVLTAGVSANVVNNNLPLDPILKGAIVVTKTTPMRNVTRGGLVPYTISARDVLAAAIPNIAIVDQVPAGFRYRAGSARLDGAAVTPIENGRLLTFPPVNFTAGETKTIDLILTVGAGVGDGEHVNQAWAVNAGSQTIVSDIAQATVRIEPDPDFDCTDILGKVFDDKNGNGSEDQGERGLPGVRVVTVAGDIITTDAEGRYHITCPMIANADRGSNFILKLDPRTLPTGYRLTTENPETVRLTQGKFVKLNFGAALLRVVRLDVKEAVFKGDAVAPAFEARIDGLIATLEGQPSVLRIVYMPRGEEPTLVHARVAALRSAIEHKWSAKAARYRLVIETEESW